MSGNYFEKAKSVFLRTNHVCHEPSTATISQPTKETNGFSFPTHTDQIPIVEEKSQPTYSISLLHLRFIHYVKRFYSANFEGFPNTDHTLKLGDRKGTITSAWKQSPSSTLPKLTQRGFVEILKPTKLHILKILFRTPTVFGKRKRYS